MAARRLVRLAIVLAVASCVYAASAGAEHVPGATYSGSLSGGRSMSFTVSQDGSYVTSFFADFLPIGCGTSLTYTWMDLALITNDTFTHTADGFGDITFAGTFTGLQSASGTVSWVGPYCESERPTVTWDATTSSPPLADLTVALSEDPDPVLVGDTMAYTVTVSNSGPMTAPDATLTQTLPTGVTFLAAQPSQGSCSHAEDSVTCSLGALARGGSATVAVQVVPTGAGELATSATVSGSRQDPNQTNNSANQSTTVQTPCIVPNVKGKRLAAAKQALARASCQTGTIARRYSKKVGKGRVLSQSPAAGIRLGNLARVNLVVSRGRRR